MVWLALLNEWRRDNPHRKHLTETKLLTCEVEKRSPVVVCRAMKCESHITWEKCHVVSSSL